MTRHLAAFAFFLALAIAITWPLATQLSTAVPDLGDPLLNAWIVDWVCHALAHAPLSLFDGPMYWPARFSIAFSENMTGIALSVLPFHLAGLDAVTVYNIALLLGFAFSGYGAWVLARMVTGNDVAALIGGVIHAFASFKIAHVQHLQIVWSGWLPLMLAALFGYWRRPTWARAALVGGAFLMNGLTNIHWLLFGGFALVLTCVLRRDGWLRLLVAVVVASLLLLPVLIPYQIVASEYGARRTSFEARLGSAAPWHWVVGSSRNLLYGRFFESIRTDERELFPGLVAVALVVLALRPLTLALSPRGGARGLDVAIIALSVLTVFLLVRDRVAIGSFSFAGADVPGMLLIVLLLVRFRPRFSGLSREELTAALWGAIGFLGSLGWYFFLHPFLFRVIAPFRATRTPARWAVVAYVGIALLAAVGASRVKKKFAWALLALAIVDVAARVNWVQVPPRAPVYEWVQRERPRAIVELPMIGPGVPFRYLHAQTFHRVPLVNGTSGFETPAHERLRKLEEALQYNDEFLRDAELLIAHEALMSDAQKAALARMELQPVARFGTDVVLRTRRGPAGTASAPPGSPPR
ncbi:MAG TPA: hypothetical protein VNI54_05465 [Thermoanaerobaculia bacterium]|nr:hypothetical protein [Thermoanaerobaculia bacterium]